MTDKRQTTYWDARDRYHNDAHFKNLVDLLFAYTVEHKFTPGELRDAAFMASLKFEETHVRSFGRVHGEDLEAIIERTRK